MLAFLFSLERSMLMSELDGVSVAVVWLLPPVVVPPLLSLVAPVVTITGVDVLDVGVPVTAQEMLWPTASEATGVVGVQAPRDKPAGRAETEHVAFVAAAEAFALFVHLMVPM
jgi:hypothetical protein